MKLNQKNLSDILIRELRMTDYNRLIKLWDDAKLPYKPKGRDMRKNIKRELKKPTAIFLVAEKNEELIGSIFSTHDGRKGWINRLAVAPEYRKKGIAAKLVNEVENRLFDMGIGIIACLIEDWNTGSMEAFEKMGYKRHNDIIYFTKRRFADV
ncbi:MAG: GNAT family N-acetyltransferase [Candidatus Stahlbacteria bacterium]|nr:MAG: GNAT family N-acetyltransferase [Candidatus Stahlbacteria bacterium]